MRLCNIVACVLAFDTAQESASHKTTSARVIEGDFVFILKCGSDFIVDVSNCARSI